MQIAIGTYDHTRALKEGSVSAPDVQFDFVEVSPITRAFRNMAADLAYDISEMALVTYMLARVFNKPIVALPIVLVRSSLLPGLVTAKDGPIQGPADLNGKTLGIRSYTQTSGVWVRGILQDGFGVDLKSLKWVTFEGAHLDEFKDPPNVSRASADKNMADMLQSGELAAAIGLPAADNLRTVVPDAAKAEADWAQKSGIRTVNHIVVVKQDVLDRKPGFKQELTELFERARGTNGASVPPIGIEPNRPAFEAIARYAYEQGITPKQYTPEELFPA
jgi:4,5-dihydroxyphthalate decarboxylase